jgi:hypothetical protein
VSMGGQYTLVNDELYQQGANDTLMKCIAPKEGQTILQDVHIGVTQVQNHSWVRRIDRGSFDPLQCMMPTLLYVGVKVANFLFARNMCRVISCRPYPLPDLFYMGTRFGRFF